MPEPTLSLTYDDLRAQIGLFLGYGTDPSQWSSDKIANVKYCLQSGLSQFYVPPPLDGESASYDWSFLRPVSNQTLPANSSTIPLPADFGGFEGSMTLLNSNNRVWYPIDLQNENYVREKFAAYPTMIGPPQCCSIQWLKGTSATAGQRAQLYYFPTTDTSYTVQFAYYVNPNYLSVAFPYHMGGMPHAETVKESCLAIAEQLLDDAATIHSMKFKERLAASIHKDRQMKPQKLGYNRDTSDDKFWDRQWNHYTDTILINGVLYALLACATLTPFLWSMP